MNWFRYISKFLLVALMLSSFDALSAGKQVTQTVIAFCVPQSDVYPFSFTQNVVLTGINPNIIEQIFTETRFPNVTIDLVKRPWKRCNADLESGEVDMMIGGYDVERERVVYPSNLGFELSDTVVSNAEVCFSTIAGRQKQKTRLGMQGKTSFLVGIEAGFSKKHSSSIKPQWLVLFNPIEKYRMLEKGRVDAIVQVCAMDGIYPIETKAESKGFTNFETLYPPYLSNPAYIIFSEKFANTHQVLVKKIIVEAQNIDKAMVYERYKPSD